MSIPQPSYPPGYNPYSLDPSQILAAMQNNALTTNIYDSTNRTVSAVNDAQRLATNEFSVTNKNIYDSNVNTISAMNDTQRLLTQEIAGVNKNIYDTIAANGIAIERTSANGMSTTERVNAQLATAVERNGSNTRETVERVNSQLATAVERNGANGMNTTERTAGQVSSAVERNGGQIMTAIEKVAGEGRLTTTIVDAASRQASNDSARDILRAVDRIGSEAVGTTKEGFSGVLQSIERNAGEGRIQTLQANGQLANTLTDVRHSILSDVNRAASEVLNSNQQNLNVLTKHVTDSAWESRTALATGFQNTSEEYLKTKHDLAQQASHQYASLLLENQKSDALITKQQDNQFAAMISKTDGHFSTLLLEQQKVKECLAAQAAQNFAVNQLEQQKIRESLSLQLQEAKYEALKHKNDLSKEMGDCCCEIKQKIDQRSQDVINTVDTLDRNRLRDEINTTNNEKNLLKFMEFGPWGNFGGGVGPGYGGYGGYGGHHHRHSRDRR